MCKSLPNGKAKCGDNSFPLLQHPTDPVKPSTGHTDPLLKGDKFETSGMSKSDESQDMATGYNPFGQKHGHHYHSLQTD